ncbi:hypothetical protein FBU31_006021, partial [Coemansia sp. 'formosensis']
MSSTLRTIPRVALRAPATAKLSALRPAPTSSARVLARAYSSQQRQYQMPRTRKAGTGGILGVLAAGALAGWYFYSKQQDETPAWKKVNYQN